MNAKSKIEEVSYKKAIAEIEKIVESLSEEGADIDTISKDIKKAVELISLCKAKLKKTENELEELFGK